MFPFVCLLVSSKLRYISSKRYECDSNRKILWGISVPTVFSVALPTRSCPRRLSAPGPDMAAGPALTEPRSPRLPQRAPAALQRPHTGARERRSPTSLSRGRGEPGWLHPPGGGAPCGSTCTANWGCCGGRGVRYTRIKEQQC